MSSCSCIDLIAGNSFSRIMGVLAVINYSFNISEFLLWRTFSFS